MINKAGYLRMDLTFYLNDYEVEYIVKAIVLVAKYWKNFQKIYTVCDSGEVKKHPVFRSDKEFRFSLHSLEEMEEKIEQEENDNRKKLSERVATLSYQLLRAELIARNVDQFLERRKNGEDFSLPM